MSAAPPPWDVDALLDDRGTEIVLCCGAGGVGKTTTSAALALRAAERGRRVAVLTVDPSRRLAQALGIAADATASAAEAGGAVRVSGVDEGAGGSLDALVLDAEGTLGALVDAALPADQAASVKANPVYASVATSFSGTQEYMAMERLSQLRAQVAQGQRPWDLIVVDTPPSRSALDFLDAPERLGRFLDGRFVRVLLAPARLGRRAGGRLASALTGGLASVMDRVLGANLLRDVEALVAGLDTAFGGFRTRAATTSAALGDERSAIVLVTAPEPDPLAEAGHFTRRLAELGLAPRAVVVNRSTRAAADLDEGAARRAAGAARGAGSEVAAEVLELQADLAARSAAEAELVARTLRDPGAAAGGAGGSGAGAPPLARVPVLDHAVVDLAGLRAVGAALAGGDLAVATGRAVAGQVDGSSDPPSSGGAGQA